MSRRVTIPYHLVADAGAKGEVVLYEVPPAQRLRIERIVVYFPAGNYGELRLRFLVGNMQVHPETGDIRGDQVVWDDEVSIELTSQSQLVLYYENVNAAEVRECFIHVLGTLE